MVFLSGPRELQDPRHSGLASYAYGLGKHHRIKDRAVTAKEAGHIQVEELMMTGIEGMTAGKAVKQLFGGNTARDSVYQSLRKESRGLIAMVCTHIEESLMRN